jgi:predicted metal-dependent peptidase
MHPALHHHVRRSGRDPKRWNVACDFAINPLLVDAGLSLPNGVLIDNRFRGMSAEQIYNILESESETEQDSGNEGEDEDPGREKSKDNASDGGDSSEPSAPITEGGVGQVLDAPPPDEETPTIEEQAREWDVAVNQATTVARQAGKVPAGLNRTLEGAAEASVDWREMLRRLWSDTIPADYSWMRPNRRHVWAGLYLPGVIREGVGEIAIAVDCSGSVNARQLRLFESEVRSILEGQRPQRVHVLYFDATVHKVETYVAGQSVHLNPAGGGGTEFGPCFDWLDEHGIQPQTLVFLTDLYGSFPPSALNLTVIVEVLFQRSLSSSDGSRVGWFPFRAVSEAVPRLRKSEGRGKQSLRQNLDGKTAGQLFNPLRRRNDGLDPFAELFNGV